MDQKPSLVSEPKKLERQKVVELVRSWAEINSDGILDPACQIFADPKIDGLVGYRLEGEHAVVFGDPVCAPKDKPALALAFQAYCQQQNKSVIYTITSEEFANWAVPNLQSVLIEFGEKFILDPLESPVKKTGSRAVLVRKKVKHALNDGAVLHEYTDQDPEIERQIEEVAKKWVEGRHWPQVFLGKVSLFKDRPGKRWFYATKDDKMVGILLLNQIKAQKGWLLNNVMITRDAPHGISELLIIGTLQVLEKENCKFVVMGPVPGKKLGRIIGLGGISGTLTRWLYQFAKKFFRIGGGEAFWDKFMPQIRSSYLVFPQHNLTISSIRALLKAFNVK